MRLTTFLEAAKETDAAFAQRIGVSPQALSRYKLGHRRPEWDVLERIKDATGGEVTPNDFLTIDRPAPAPVDAQPASAA